MCLTSFSPCYKLREWGQSPPFHNEREQGRYRRSQRAGMLRYRIQGIWPKNFMMLARYWNWITWHEWEQKLVANKHLFKEKRQTVHFMVSLWCKTHACRLICLSWAGGHRQGKAKMVPLVEYLELRFAFLPQPRLKHTVSKSQSWIPELTVPP